MCDGDAKRFQRGKAGSAGIMPEITQLDVMTRDVPLVSHRASLSEVLKSLQERRVPPLGVVDGAGCLIGLITPENVGEMMMVQAARGAGPGGSGGAPPATRDRWAPAAPGALSAA